MNPTPRATGREQQSDAALLCAVAQDDLQALLELHRRYAPSLYALAQRLQLSDPERRVQEAWLSIRRHAHCHARTSLEARVWIVAAAHRSLCAQP